MNEKNIDITQAVDDLYKFWQSTGGGNALDLKHFMEKMVEGMFGRYVYEKITESDDTYNSYNPN